MTAPKIDTQAPALNIAFGRDNSELPQGWTLHLGDGGVHYREGNSASSYSLEQGLRAYLATLADLADARAAAAAMAMREAAAEAVITRKTVYQKIQQKHDAGDPSDSNAWERVEHTIEAHEHALDAIRALALPDTAALDRLIAERVREAFIAGFAYSAEGWNREYPNSDDVSEAVEEQATAYALTPKENPA